MFDLDPMDRMPLYEQIQAQIARHVMHGLLKEGDQLPSVRQLALDVGINPNTVQKAYRELERRGLIVSVAGRGSFIAADNVLKEQLREASAEKLREAIRIACAAGLSEEDILSIVRETSAQEVNHD